MIKKQILILKEYSGQYDIETFKFNKQFLLRDIKGGGTD